MPRRPNNPGRAVHTYERCLKPKPSPEEITKAETLLAETEGDGDARHRAAY